MSFRKSPVPGDICGCREGPGLMDDNLLFAALAVLILTLAGGITSAQSRFRIRRRH